MNAMERLNKMMKQKNSRICAGIDPEFEKLPTELKEKNISKEEAIFEFCREYINTIYDYVSAVKINVAFFETKNLFPIYREIAKYAKNLGLFVIGDLKRADIGSTAEAYAKDWLGAEEPFDCITINPYFGTDGIKPFVEVAAENGKGVFVLAKTSNKSSEEIQNQMLFETRDYVYEKVADLIVNWGNIVSKGEKYSPVGAVVGATHPKEAEALRKRMPNTMFLVPGYGVQGATAEDAVVNFDKEGLGAIINSSRGIMYAYSKKHKDIANRFGWKYAIEMAASESRQDINAAIEKTIK